MASLRFTDVQARPTEFLDFSRLTLEEFQTGLVYSLIGHRIG